MDDEAWDQAIGVFSQAMDLLPEPKRQWEAAMWLYASIGDAHFMKGDYAEAKESFFDAMNCPDGIENPFVLLRAGETLYKLGDLEGAKEYMLRAYMLEGEEIFEDEDPEYMEFMKKHFDMDE
jgi:tetratricopeptide (TPR) repeat protein